MTDFEKARDEAAAKYANGNYGSYHMDLQAFKAGADWARRELDADIHVNHCGHIVKWEDLCRRFEDVSFEVQKERDALKAEVERLKKDMNAEATSIGLTYRDGLERGYKWQIDALKADRDRFLHESAINAEHAEQEREKSKRLAEATADLIAQLKDQNNILPAEIDNVEEMLKEFEGEK